MEAIADPAESFPPPYYQPRRADIGSDGDAAAAAADDLKGDQHPQQHPQQQQQQQQQQQHTTRFADSIESLMRNIIQKQKIDMANEVIDAGRFDMQTTNEERRKTLEEMLLVGGRCTCTMLLLLVAAARLVVTRLPHHTAIIL
jgi:hypothetical protein